MGVTRIAIRWEDDLSSLFIAMNTEIGIIKVLVQQDMLQNSSLSSDYLTDCACELVVQALRDNGQPTDLPEGTRMVIRDGIATYRQEMGGRKIWLPADHD